MCKAYMLTWCHIHAARIDILMTKVSEVLPWWLHCWWYFPQARTVKHTVTVMHTVALRVWRCSIDMSFKAIWFAHLVCILPFCLRRKSQWRVWILRNMDIWEAFIYSFIQKLIFILRWHYPTWNTCKNYQNLSFYSSSVTRIGSGWESLVHGVFCLSLLFSSINITCLFTDRISIIFSWGIGPAVLDGGKMEMKVVIQTFHLQILPGQQFWVCMNCISSYVCVYLESQEISLCLTYINRYLSSLTILRNDSFPYLHMPHIICKSCYPQLMCPQL